MPARRTVSAKPPTPTEATETADEPVLAPTVARSRVNVTVPVAPGAMAAKPLPCPVAVPTSCSLKPSATAPLAKVRALVRAAPRRTLPKSTPAGIVPVVVATRKRSTRVTPASVVTTWCSAALSMPWTATEAKAPVVAPVELRTR